MDARMIHILSSQDLPLLAEVYKNGTSVLCKIVEFRPTKDPTVQVQILTGCTEEECCTVIVDIGQITTIWTDLPMMTTTTTTTVTECDDTDNYDDDDDKNSSWDTRIADQMQRLPVGVVESSMDQLYQRHVGQAKAKSHKKTTLSKKQITKLCHSIDDSEERHHAEQVLRQVMKAGPEYCKIVDSKIVAGYLCDPDHGIILATTTGRSSDSNNNPQWRQQQEYRALAARLLAQDSELGGRFKRMPSTFVSRELNSNHDSVQSLTIINGGWLVVDQSVRAGSEARKFAGRVLEVSNTSSISTVSGGGERNGSTSTTAWTISDERIAQRLECLAMGEVLSTKQHQKSENWNDVGQNLELDVRETMKVLGMPATPEAARDVLVRIGRWSKGATPAAVQPWSPKVLEAARWYADYCDTIKASKTAALQNDRIDLTKLPFLCVDAQRTSFRDDAIGLRPRSVTGRKVSKASKWEILISIVDVSDIYLEGQSVTSNEVAPSHRDRFKVLRDAAATRAVSRYDLPLGPLHLLPPVALKALSFDTVKPGERSKTYHRCVTVWVYIDETTGKLLDAGVERSAISQPVALSYATATNLLEGKLDTTGDDALGKTRQLLCVLWRNLHVWSQHRRKGSVAAQRREDRLASKEYVASQTVLSDGKQPRRDDGSDGFQRTSGHKLVDMSLDIYSYVIADLIKREKAFVPQQAGSEQGRGGRVATAPLRRYIDGMAQRQVLSVLCNHGARAMTKAECIRVSQQATEAYNSVSNIRSVKKGSNSLSSSSAGGQKGAVRKLELYLAGDRNKIIPAGGTGISNEVVIKGVGAIAKVKGMKQPLNTGQEVLVKVLKIDADTGNLSVTLVDTGHF